MWHHALRQCLLAPRPKGGQLVYTCTGVHPGQGCPPTATTPPIRRRNPNNSAGQFGGPIFRRTASQSPGLWPWPPKHTVPLVAVLSETCGNPCKLKNFLHCAGSIRRKMTIAERK